jgi:hypothetical protein
LAKLLATEYKVVLARACSSRWEESRLSLMHRRRRAVSASVGMDPPLVARRKRFRLMKGSHVSMVLK